MMNNDLTYQDAPQQDVEIRITRGTNDIYKVSAVAGTRQQFRSCGFEDIPVIVNEMRNNLKSETE